MRKILSALFASALVLGGIMFSACDSGSGGTNPYVNYQQRIINPASAATASSLSLFAASEVSIGETEAAVNVSFSPANAQVKVFCDTNVVSFSGEPDEIAGTYLVRFKPVSLGTFVITAQSGLLTKSIIITVSAKVISVSVTGGDDPIENGATVQLTANKIPAISPAKIEWASSDNNVATVDSNGLVTAKKPGIATITATANNSDSESFNHDNLVAGYKDITVKGFFLSDTCFFLCQKDLDDEVEAKLVGIEGASVEWTSSDTDLFTVVDISADTKKAKLKYATNGNGQGVVTAKLKDGSGNVLKQATADVYVTPFFMLALGDSIAAGYAPKRMDQDDASLEETDMLEAYEKYMKRRKGGNDPNYVCEFAYPAVLYNKLKTTKHINFLSYAMSGDNTTMLLDKLKATYRDGTIATKQGEILEAVSQADYITLCIGANDILLKVFGLDLFFRDANWFKEAFEKELTGFKTRYDEIIKKLTENGQHVYAMSIYSPYHHFTKQYIPEDQYTPLYKDMTEKIVKINEHAEDVLNKMNDYIKTKADSDVNMTFVDVAPVFNNKPQEDHMKYIHAIPTRMNLQKLTSTFGRSIPIWFDPHPTKLGAETIADKYCEVLN